MAVSGNGARPLSILLVEDSEIDAKVTLRAFSKSTTDTKIHHASSGEEALDFLNQCDSSECPHIILMDLRMPKMDGFETLRRIKADPKFRHIPTAILSSSDHEEDVLRSYREGAVTYISKPVNYQEFNKIVEHFNSYWNVVAKLPKPDE